MEEGLLSLKWNNHQTTLVHLLKVLREQCFYTDAVLVCGSRFFGVHRLVLMACSDYFCEIFSQVKDCPKPVIVLQDIASSELEALLDYMYLGEVDVHQTKLPNLIKAAECLHIKGLAACEDEPTKPLKTLVNKSKKEVLSNNSRSFDSVNSFPSSKQKGSLLNSGYCDTKNNRHSFESEPPKKRQRNLDNQSNLENSNRYSSEVRSLSSSSSEIVQVQNDCTSSNEKIASHIDNSNSSHVRRNHSENTLEGQDCSNNTVDCSLIKSEDVVSNDVVLELKVEDEEPQQQQQDSDLLHSSLGSEGQHFQHYLHTGIDEHLFSDVDQGGDVGGLHGMSGEAADLSAASAGIQPMSDYCTPSLAAAHSLLEGSFTNTPYNSGSGSVTTATGDGLELRCPQCSRQFTDKYKRDRHLLIHTGLKPYHCPFCPYRSSRKDPVIRHIRFRHVAQVGHQGGGGDVGVQQPQEQQQHTVV